MTRLSSEQHFYFSSKMALFCRGRNTANIQLRISHWILSVSWWFNIHNNISCRNIKVSRCWSAILVISIAFNHTSNRFQAKSKLKGGRESTFSYTYWKFSDVSPLHKYRQRHKNWLELTGKSETQLLWHYVASPLLFVILGSRPLSQSLC